MSPNQKSWMARLLLLAGLLAGVPVQAGVKFEHWVLPSGAQVFLASSHGIPMVDVQLDFDAGSRRDPATQVGLAAVTATLLSKGIAASTNALGQAQPALDENALGQAWADLGASLGVTASDDRMSFALRSLTYPDLLPRAASLAARQIGHPAWRAEVWTTERERLAASLREADTRPATLAQKAFYPAVFGAHPYGHITTPQSLARIDVDDMRAFYRRHVQACRARISLVGDLNRAQAQELALALLAELPAPGPAACVPLPALPDVTALAAPTELRLPMASAQAHVLIGQPGVARSDPDYFALLVGNYILGGGGFVSRLTTEVREKRGLSYSVYSAFAPALQAGAFTLGLQTRPDQAEQALQVAREVLSRFVQDGPSEAEVKAAQNNLIGGFALRLDSNRKLLENLANMAWHGLPLDYLERWTEHVAAVRSEDIRRAMRRVLQPERMVTVLVGAQP